HARTRDCGADRGAAGARTEAARSSLDPCPVSRKEVPGKPASRQGMKPALPRRPLPRSPAEYSGCGPFAALEASVLAPVLGQTSDIRPALSSFFVVAKIEHGRASQDLARVAVESSENPVPQEICDAEIPGLIMEMVSEMEPLDPRQECRFRLIGQMLD